MALPANADVRLLLGRIRPNADWGWKGGAANNASLVRWRDSVQTEPDEAEYLSEYTVVEQEKVTTSATKATIKSNANSATGRAHAMLSAADVRQLLTILLLERKALSDTGVVLATENWSPPGGGTT